MGLLRCAYISLLPCANRSAAFKRRFPPLFSVCFSRDPRNRFYSKAGGDPVGLSCLGVTLRTLPEGKDREKRGRWILDHLLSPCLPLPTFSAPPSPMNVNIKRTNAHARIKQQDDCVIGRCFPFCFWPPNFALPSDGARWPLSSLFYLCMPLLYVCVSHYECTKGVREWCARIPLTLQ